MQYNSWHIINEHRMRPKYPNQDSQTGLGDEIHYICIYTVYLDSKTLQDFQRILSKKVLLDCFICFYFTLFHNFLKSMYLFRKIITPLHPEMFYSLLSVSCSLSEATLGLCLSSPKNVKFQSPHLLSLMLQLS